MEMEAALSQHDRACCTPGMLSQEVPSRLSRNKMGGSERSRVLPSA